MLGLVLALCLAPLSGQGAEAPRPPAEAAPLPQDPSLHLGVLPNGLRYGVMRNPNPKGGVSIRLQFDVGSREETQAERGAAHFVEHMAFRGARSFQDGDLERALALIGVGSGRDHNADTSVRWTAYRLDLTQAKPENLTLAFRWLRDIGDGLVFDPAVVDRERGVVLAEMGTDSGADSRLADQVRTFLAPGLTASQRNPIGVEASLRAMTPEMLQAFHARWYRPQTARVVMVGDMAPEAMIAAITEAFASWTAQGPTPERADLGDLDENRGLQALVVRESQVASYVAACRVRGGVRTGVTDTEKMARARRGQVWLATLNSRLSELARGHAALRAASATSSDLDGGEATCLNAWPKGAAWEPALAAIQGELARFQRDGPTELEVEGAVAQLRSDLLAEVTAASTQSSPDLAASLALSLAEDRIVMEPRAALRAFNQAVEGLTVAQVKAAFAASWRGPEPLLILTAAQPPTAEALMDSWRRNLARAGPAPYQDAAKVPWGYGPIGEPGPIARRERLEADVTRVTFRNGVVLNLKATEFENDQVSLRLQFGAGRGAVAAKDHAAIALAVRMFAAGGLGRHSHEELLNLMGEPALEFDLTLTPDLFWLEDSVPKVALSARLRVLAAFMSDPGFRKDMEARLPTEVEDLFRNRSSDAWRLGHEALMEAAAPGSPFGRVDPATLTSLTAADLAALLKPSVTQDPIEITLVGDMEEALAIDLVARTFGRLPPRRDPAFRRPDTYALKYTPVVPREIQVTHQGSADRAVVIMVWPLFGPGPTPPRETATLNLLAAIFDDELRHRVREHLGKTYSPSVEAQMPLRIDQGELDALVETHPADVSGVRNEMAAVAASLAGGNITLQMLEAARRPLLSATAAAMATNDWWADAITGSTPENGELEAAITTLADLRAVTLSQVKAAAATWLTPNPIVAVVRPEPSANGGAK